MTPDPVWTARAESDLLVVFGRLEETNEGSGVRLLEMIDSALRLLSAMPEMAPLWAPPLRRLMLKNLRFGLFYTRENRGLVVHAVCDLRQDRAAILRHLQIHRDDPSND